MLKLRKTFLTWCLLLCKTWTSETSQFNTQSKVMFWRAKMFGTSLRGLLWIRAPRGMGWDEKNRPMGWDLSSCPMRWDSFQKFSSHHGMGLATNIFRPMGWDHFQKFLVLSHPIHSVGQHTRQILCIKNKIS
jgi:hypothetical protein